MCMDSGQIDPMARLMELTAELTDKDEEMEREKERYKVISEIVIAANKSDTHTDLFSETIPIICEYFNFDGGGAYLIHQDMGKAILKYSLNVDEKDKEKYEYVSIMDNPYRETLTEGTITVISGEAAEEFNCKMLVFAPIISPCGVIGGIFLFSDSNTSISPSAKALLPTIGRYLGDSLRRIWSEKLFKAENDRYKKLLAENDELICDNSSKTQELTAINEELHRHIKHLDIANKTLFSIIDAIPLPIFWKNLDGVYLGANKRFYDITQTKPYEVIGNTLHELFSPIYWDEYEIGDENAIECQHAEYIGVYHSKEDNKEHKGRFVKNIFYDYEHKPLGLICIIYPCEDACNERELEIKA